MSNNTNSISGRNFHPLPPRPIGVGRPQSIPHRPSFLNTNPSSPRVQVSASSRPPTGLAGSVQSPNPIPDFPDKPRPLDAEDLETCFEKIQWGTGWTIHWRSWDAPSLHNFAGPSKETNSKKRSRKSDDTLEEAASLDTGTLKSKLQSLPAMFNTVDPLEKARNYVLLHAENAKNEDNLLDWLHLVSYIKVDLDTNKEKDVEEDLLGSIRRSLWVFALEKSTGPSSIDALNSLSFEGLTETKQGVITHPSLFPKCYKSGIYTNPRNLLLSEALSVIQTSNEFDTEFGCTDNDQLVAFKAFLSCLSSSIVTAILQMKQTSTLDSSVRASRLGDSLVFVPENNATSPSRKKIPPFAASANFICSLQEQGVTIEPIISSIPLLTFPHITPVESTPVVLAPFNIPAYFYKFHPRSQSDKTSKLRESWQSTIKALGVELSDEQEEGWISCKIAFPVPKTNTDLNLLEETSEKERYEYLQVVWPQNLVFLDGSVRKVPPPPMHKRFSENASRHESVSPSPALSMDRTNSDNESVPTRRNFNPQYSEQYAEKSRSRAFTLFQQSNLDKTHKRRLRSMTESVAEMLRLVEARKDQRANEEREALLERERASAAENLASAPINVRTPLSLGGASTEGASPADRVFAPIPTILPVLDIETVYPSPLEVAVKPTPAEPMSIDSVFEEFSWVGDVSTQNHNQQQNVAHQLDDGMGLMLGALTEDDFSFFDDDPSIPTASLLLEQPFGGSPKFVDHFAHLNAATPFASVGSPASFGNPHIGSPLLPFQHDHTPGSYAYSISSPYRTKPTPKTPFTPIIESDTVEVETVPNSAASSIFDPVLFGNIHRLCDQKYDSSIGKFALPGLEKSPMTEFAHPWHVSVCHPKLSAAIRMKEKRRKNTIISPTRVPLRNWISKTENSSDTDTSDEEEISPYPVLQRNITESHQLDNFIKLDYETWLDHSFGTTLSIFQSNFRTAVYSSPVVKAPLRSKVPPITTQRKSNVTELLVSSWSDLLAFNPGFRDHILEGTIAPSNTPSVYPAAISTVKTALMDFFERFGIENSLNGSIRRHSSPYVQLKTQNALMQIKPKSLDYWKSMAFEPLGGTKDLAMVLIVEESTVDLQSESKAWLANVMESYQASRLGKPVGIELQFTTPENGVVFVPSGSLSNISNRQKLKSICVSIFEALRAHKQAVVFVADPTCSSKISSNSSISFIMTLLKQYKGAQQSVILYPIPMTHISVAPETLGISLVRSTEDLVFHVYNQVQAFMPRLSFPVPETFPSANPALPSSLPFVRPYQAPVFTLCPLSAQSIQYDMAWPTTTLELQNRHRLIAVYYYTMPYQGEPFTIQNGTFSANDWEWIITCCMDEHGEMWDLQTKLVNVSNSIYPEMSRVQVVWMALRSVIETSDVEWRVIIARRDVMSVLELKTWHVLLKERIYSSPRPLHVTVVHFDEQPTLFVTRSKTDQSIPGNENDMEVDTEEGELLKQPATSRKVNKPRVPLDFVEQEEPQYYSYTHEEPVSRYSKNILLSPLCTTFILHAPRDACLEHRAAQSLNVANDPVSGLSVLGIQIISCHSTRASSPSIGKRTFGEHVDSIREFFVNLCILGRIRWGLDGTIPAPLFVLRLAEIAINEVRETDN